MARSLKLGVRELVEFCCRRGDLGGDTGPGVAALDGIDTHQRVQRRYRAEAEAEYRVALARPIDDYTIELGGRIDLLFAATEPPRVEEIKTVYAHAGSAAGDDGVHWGQLECYAACYAAEQDLARVELCLLRVDLQAREERRETRVRERAELDAFVDSLLREYLSWHKKVLAHRVALREQARALAFPHPDYRPQQRRFAAEVFRAARDGGRLLIEAPTGSGKTISTLFPAIRAIGEDFVEQIVFLSAKVSGQRQAVAALEALGCDLGYVVLQAKARACPCRRELFELDADDRCLRCVGFFDRLPAARAALFACGRLDVDAIRAVADEHRLCPFELALQMLPWVDAIVCDFNYVFDPLVQLAYFRGDARRKLLLIDELHNLVDRARGMYSARLARGAIDAALAAPNAAPVARALRALKTSLDRELRALPGDEIVAGDPPAALLTACRRCVERIGVELFGGQPLAAPTLELVREIVRCIRVGELYAAHHRTLARKPLRQRALRLLCVNACDYLATIYPLFAAVCGFSGTLSPAEHFTRALGLGDACRSLRLPPAFPPARLGVFVGAFVDARYRERERHIDAICAAIAACRRARPGNYLVFFTAYAFMQQVHARFAELYPGIETLLQQREFDDAAQARFLARFFDAGEQLGFAILGGRFAEGIDYRGDALIGAIVVGAGLPQADLEQRLIREDFDAMGLDGFDHAFRFPGLIRVQQSAGRVIRSEHDRGVVVLLDARFAHDDYARHLPEHWQVRYCNDVESLEQSLTGFWNEPGETDGANRYSAM